MQAHFQRTPLRTLVPAHTAAYLYLQLPLSPTERLIRKQKFPAPQGVTLSTWKSDVIVNVLLLLLGYIVNVHRNSTSEMYYYPFVVPRGTMETKRSLASTTVCISPKPWPKIRLFQKDSLTHLTLL